MVFNAKKFIASQVEDAKSKLGSKKAVVALSGGVDSSVASLLVSMAIGKNLHAVFVDTGLMRLNEALQVKHIFEKTHLNLQIIDAKLEFLDALTSVKDPEQKRKIIGKKFIEIFENYAKKHHIEVLVQGTIAPDWIESGGSGGRDTIKSHHNVGGLPEEMNLMLYEPLRDLYKHEVRALASELNLPKEISQRQPFPGPGLAVRIVGEITAQKVQIVQKCCDIIEKELESAHQNKEIELPWQYFGALLDTKTVGVRGDERSYMYTVVVRAVRSLDGMTANFSHIPPKILDKISSRITNEVEGVGRVLYDITNKPPATVEME